MESQCVSLFCSDTNLQECLLKVNHITILGRTVLSQVHSTTNSGEVDLDVSSHFDLDAANFHLLTHHRLYVSYKKVAMVCLSPVGYGV